MFFPQSCSGRAGHRIHCRIRYFGASELDASCSPHGAAHRYGHSTGLGFASSQSRAHAVSTGNPGIAGSAVRPSNRRLFLERPGAFQRNLEHGVTPGRLAEFVCEPRCRAASSTRSGRLSERIKMSRLGLPMRNVGVSCLAKVDVKRRV